MYVGALSGRRGDLLLGLLGDLAHEGHLVERQLVLPRRALHDGREEGLRVEEPGQPHRRRHAVDDVREITVTHFWSHILNGCSTVCLILNLQFVHI